MQCCDEGHGIDSSGQVPRILRNEKLAVSNFSDARDKPTPTQSMRDMLYNKQSCKSQTESSV